MDIHIYTQKNTTVVFIVNFVSSFNILETVYFPYFAFELSGITPNGYPVAYYPNHTASI